MTRMSVKLILMSIGVMGVSACGSGNSSPPPPPPAPPPVGSPPPTTPPPPTSVAGQLGAGFAAIFGAAANSQPKDPSPSDIVPVNKTAQPINF